MVNESSWYLSFVPRMNQIGPMGTEIWYRTDKKCGRTDRQMMPKLYPSDFVRGYLELSDLEGNKTFQHKIVNNFLPIILAYVLGAQKNRLIETVLLSTNNISFG